MDSVCIGLTSSNRVTFASMELLNVEREFSKAPRVRPHECALWSVSLSGARPALKIVWPTDGPYVTGRLPGRRTTQHAGHR